MFWPAEGWRPARRRRKPLEIGITPLIDIVFLLLIFFMLTSRFMVQEGIEVDLPVTDAPHAVTEEQLRRIYLRTDGTLFFQGGTMTFRDLDRYLAARDPSFMESPFEILSDRKASVQSVVSLMELLRERGARKVTIATVRDREVGDSR